MSFFSIIIPSYNVERVLERCIKSIVNQTFVDFEIIIQDNLSADQTIDILEKFNDNRVKIFSQKDRGVYDAMNKGVSHSSGDWLLFLGADDWLYNNAVLENVHNEIIKHTNEKFIYGNVKINGNCSWASDGEIYRGNTTIGELFESNICHQSIFYNRDIFKDGRIYDLKYPYSADHDFNIYCSSRFSTKYVNIIISNFAGGGLSSTENDVSFGKYKWQNIVEYFGFKLLNKDFKIYKSKFRQTAKEFYQTKKYILALTALIIYLYLKLQKIS